MDLDYAAAMHRLRAAALRSIAAHDYPEVRDPHHAAEAAYADEQFALAARDVVAAVEALPPSEQPVGWASGAVTA